MTANAYDRILPARYLKKGPDGEPIESQEELFTRIGQNVAIAEAVYTDEDVHITPDCIKPDHPRRDELTQEVFEHVDIVKNPDSLETPLTEENAKHVAYEPLMSRLDADGHTESLTRVQDRAAEFTEEMEQLGWMPNSPTIMNAGDELQQLSACFVNSPDDDIGDIHKKAREAALTFQSGGGMGYAFWKLRPYGDVVGSSGGIASGPVTFMRTYDQLCETIAQGGTRRGAQMGVMRVSHPDVIWFIHAKRKDVSLAETLRLNDPDDFRHSSFTDAIDEARELIDADGRVPDHLRNAVEGHLSNFNISVGITDEFMDAVKADGDYTFKNPRDGEAHIATPETKEMYGWFGLGEYVEVGEPLTVPARVVWDAMITGAHENGEPGIVFLDRINDDHSFPTESTPTAESDEYEILSTNPCGEQPLMEYEPCNLGHINLSTIVSEDRELWFDFDGDIESFLEQAINWEDFNDRIRLGTNFLDNVVTMSDFPIDEIERAAAENRKIGLGIMGLAQMFIQLGVEYGSDAGNEVARQVMVHINHQTKDISHDLSHQRGVFSNWEDSKYADPTAYPDWFALHTGEDPEDWADGYPIRNHNTTTIAPTGTTSMLGNTSGGCEPIYSVARYKNVSQDVQGEDKLVEFDDYFLQVLEANGIDVETVKSEALEQMEANRYDGISGLSTVPDELGDVFVTASELSALDHASVQCACQEGVDSAISKTTNAPADQTIEGAKETFEFVYDNGGKGVTYYRQGTRSKQVLTTNNEEWSDTDVDEESEAVLQEAGVEVDDYDALSEAIEAAVSNSSVETTSGTPRDDESHVQATTPRVRPPSTYGSTRRVKTGYGKMYVTVNEDVEGLHEVFATIGKSGGFTESMLEALARVTSMSLRAGVGVDEVISQLENISSPKPGWDDGEHIKSIPDGVAAALKRHIADPETVNPDASEGVIDHQQMQLPTDGGEAEPESTVEKLVSDGHSPECPNCSEMTLVYSEGCKSCETCGWSEC
jgi:ribonucleoside-diphosphate reductase alpha chain